MSRHTSKRDTLALYGCVLFAMSCIGPAVDATEPPRAMSPAEWEKYRTRDTVEEAMRILSNPAWHLDDPWIKHFRLENEDPQRAAPERTESEIASREQLAIQTVIASSLPRDQKKGLLSQYSQHHNRLVSALCLVELVSSEYWSADRAMAYTRAQDATSHGWHLLLTYLPNHVAFDIKADIARELLRSVRRIGPDRARRTEPAEAIDAVRILLESEDEDDRAWIHQAVQMYPDSALLWCAVSRLPNDPETERVARSMYEDSSKSRVVRSAAALVFAKNDSQIMSAVVENVVSAVRSFGSREYMEWVYRGLSEVGNPARAEKLLRAVESEAILAVAYELPKEVLRPRLEELLQYPYMTLGAGMCLILAKRLPTEFVEAAGRIESLPGELAEPLVLAKRQSPEVSAKVASLLPAEVAERAEQRLDKSRNGASTMRNLALWD